MNNFLKKINDRTFIILIVITVFILIQILKFIFRLIISQKGVL